MPKHLFSQGNFSFFFLRCWFYGAQKYPKDIIYPVEMGRSFNDFLLVERTLKSSLWKWDQNSQSWGKDQESWVLNWTNTNTTIPNTRIFYKQSKYLLLVLWFLLCPGNSCCPQMLLAIPAPKFPSQGDLAAPWLLNEQQSSTSPNQFFNSPQSL